MDIYDNEIEIIKMFHNVQCSEVLLLPENSEECEHIFLAVHQEDQWSKWKDTSGKADMPPDFYSDELGLMMDVMRVDDHGRIRKNGKSNSAGVEQIPAQGRDLRQLDAAPHLQCAHCGQPL